MKDYQKMAKGELIERLKALEATNAAAGHLPGHDRAESEFVPVKELQDLKAALDAHSIVASLPGLMSKSRFRGFAGSCVMPLLRRDHSLVVFRQ